MALHRDIPRCIICGEETTHNTQSSFFGSVHRFGPRDHDFVSDQHDFDEDDSDDDCPKFGYPRGSDF